MIGRQTGTVADIPPFRFLAGRSLDEAVRMAADAMSIARPADILLLTWKLRAAAEGRG